MNNCGAITVFQLVCMRYAYFIHTMNRILERFLILLSSVNRGLRVIIICFRLFCCAAADGDLVVVDEVFRPYVQRTGHRYKDVRMGVEWD
jgi:hypothetical protein